MSYDFTYMRYLVSNSYVVCTDFGSVTEAVLGVDGGDYCTAL